MGDALHPFSIQSVSKPFVFALVCDALGHEAVLQKVGVNGTGLPFNSVMAIELNADRTMNPMVNAGAIATTSLVPGSTADEKWEFLRAGLSRFAGRELEIDEDVYASETATNLRNQGIAHLLDGYDRLYFDPDEATDVYTRQCSLLVTAHDLAVMGATLADGGINPHHRRAGHRRPPLQAGPRRARHRRPLRAVRRLALRDRPARQERGERRHRRHLARARAPSAPSPRRSTRPATACAASAWSSTCPSAWASTCSRRSRSASPPAPPPCAPADQPRPPTDRTS